MFDPKKLSLSSCLMQKINVLFAIQSDIVNNTNFCAEDFSLAYRENNLVISVHSSFILRMMQIQKDDVQKIVDVYYQQGKLASNAFLLRVYPKKN